jgi:hypothetical protein
MVFNIGNQTGGVINNVAGDQHVSGTQSGVAVSVGDAREAAEALRVAVQQADLPLTREQRAAATAEADAIATELSQDDPPKEQIAGRLSRLTHLLDKAGALAGAAASVIGPLVKIAGWLGPLGASVMAMVAV